MVPGVLDGLLTQPGPAQASAQDPAASEADYRDPVAKLCGDVAEVFGRPRQRGGSVVDDGWGEPLVAVFCQRPLAGLVAKLALGWWCWKRQGAAPVPAMVPDVVKGEGEAKDV